jgi:CTD kinase subunit alpha
MIGGQPLCTGKDELRQLERIWRTFGTPDTESYPEVTKLSWWLIMKPKKEFKSTLRSIFGEKLSETGLKFAEDLTNLNPSLRPNTKTILDHPYFTESPKLCTNSELPKLENDWHEFESKKKLREEENVENMTMNDTSGVPLKADAVDTPMKRDDRTSSNSYIKYDDDRKLSSSQQSNTRIDGDKYYNSRENEDRRSSFRVDDDRYATSSSRYNEDRRRSSFYDDRRDSYNHDRRNSYNDDSRRRRREPSPSQSHSMSHSFN